MPKDPATEVPARPSPGGRVTPGAGPRVAVVAAGHRGDVVFVRDHLSDSDESVRAAALGALARCGALDNSDLLQAFVDPAAVVRRRACEEAGWTPNPGHHRSPRDQPGDPSLLPGLVALVTDPHPLVAEAACWALGERRAASAVDSLSAAARSHPDVRCREAATAALGAIGHPSGLAAVLEALGDKPTVRRRAAVALVSFDGPEVDQALHRCLQDHDWQVRQVAEILLED